MPPCLGRRLGHLHYVCQPWCQVPQETLAPSGHVEIPPKIAHTAQLVRFQLHTVQAGAQGLLQGAYSVSVTPDLPAMCSATPWNSADLGPTVADCSASFGQSTLSASSSCETIALSKAASFCSSDTYQGQCSHS